MTRDTGNFATMRSTVAGLVDVISGGATVKQQQVIRLTVTSDTRGTTVEPVTLTNWRIISTWSVCVVIVNGIYVYVTLTQSTLWGFCALSLLVVFKVGWNLRVVPVLLSNWCDKEFWASDMYGSTVSSGTSRISSSKGSALAHSAMLMFNNVIAPCLATAAADNSCFLNFFVAPDAIESSFDYPQCLVYSLTSCLEYEDSTITTEFSPPFIYSYQCTSSLLTKYVPMFLVMYTFTGIVLPIVHMFARYKLDKESEKMRGADGNIESGGNSSSWPVKQTIARDDHPADTNNVEKGQTVYLMVKRVERYTCGIITGMHWPVVTIMDDDQRIALAQYKIKSITCNLIGSFAVLLTFGLSYPPLALVIMCSICSTATVLRHAIHEHLTNCPKIVFEFLCHRLEKESYGLSSILQRSSFALLSHSALFCFFILVDMSQDFIIPFLMLALPVLFCCLYSYRGIILAAIGILRGVGTSDNRTTGGLSLDTKNPMISEHVDNSVVKGSSNSGGSRLKSEDFEYHDSEEDLVSDEGRYSSMRMSTTSVRTHGPSIVTLENTTNL